MLWIATSLLAVSLAVYSQSPPKFDVPRLDQEGNFRTALVGDTNADYAVEVSTDLIHWSLILTNPSTTGRFDLAGKVEGAARFYRGRLVQNAGEDPPAVFATADPIHRLTTVITPAGGDLALYDPAGILYILTVPTNAVVEPVEISMALVNSMTGQPFDDTNWHAVVFEPSGLEFMAPARLTIQYLSGAPDTNVVSYWFTGDGTDFGLLPDRLLADRIEFDLFHFSVAGVGRMTPAQYRRQSVRRVNRIRDRVAQQIATVLKPLRDAGALPAVGVRLPPDIEAQVVNYNDALVDSLIKEESKLTNDCAFLRQHLPALLSAQEPLPAHRVPASDRVHRLHNIVCAASSRCFQELAAQCRSGKNDTWARMVEWESIAIKRFGCHSALEEASKWTNCLPVWYGAIKYSEEGETFEGTPPDPNSLWCNHKLHFSGVVTNAQLLPLSPAAYPVAVSVDMLGVLSIGISFLSHHKGVAACEGDDLPTYTLVSEFGGGLKTNTVWKVTLYQSAWGDLTFVNEPPPRVTLTKSGVEIETVGPSEDCGPGEHTTTNLSSSYTCAVPRISKPVSDPGSTIVITPNHVKWTFRTDRFDPNLCGNVKGIGTMELWRRP